MREFYVVVTRKIASPLAEGDRLLTEDLTHGATIRSVQIQNPFA